MSLSFTPFIWRQSPHILCALCYIFARCVIILLCWWKLSNDTYRTVVIGITRNLAFRPLPCSSKQLNSMLKYLSKLKLRKRPVQFKVLFLKNHNRFSRILAIVITGPIFGLLPLNSIFMAVSMFDMEQVNSRQINPLSWFIHIYISVSIAQTFANFDILVLLFDTSCIISALLWPYLFCHFADLTTNKIASIGDAAYNSNWYDFPVDLQKHMVLVVMRSRDKFYFTGLGLVRSTLEVFGEVSNWQNLIWISWIFD